MKPEALAADAGERGLVGAADAPDLPDDLHPNPAGYVRMGERFVREVFASDGLGLS